MNPHNLRDVLKNLKSDKATERGKAITSLRQIFDTPHFVNNFHVTEGPRAWLRIYEALFIAVEKEKIAATKTSNCKSSGTSSVAAERRLEDAAGTVRWLTERTVHRLETPVTESVFAHLLQTMVHRKELLAPVALHYLKALRCLVGYTPHLEHLNDADWIRIVEVGFNCLLGDPIGRRFQDDGKGLPQDADDSGLFEGDLNQDEYDIPTTPGTGKRKRNRAEPLITPLIGSKRSRSSLMQISVTYEQVESMSLISVLLGSSASPILSSKYIYLPSSILTRLRRFLKQYSCDTSLLHDYVVALASTLSQLTLNNTLEVTKFALDSWVALRGLWATRNKRIKEGLVSIFRMLFPFVTSEKETSRLPEMPFNLVDGLRTLSSVLDGEADNKRGLSFECLRLELVDDSRQQLNSAFIAKSFRYGWNFDGNQALAWAILELRADCIAKLFQLSESVQPPPTSGSSPSSNKRLRKEDHIVSLLTSIRDRSPSNVRSYHLQTLLFIIDRHWPAFPCELQNKITSVLLQFVSSDDGAVLSWVFLCFAAIAAAASSSGVTEATWDTIWTKATRRANVPSVSRAACHAAYTILLHTRVHTQKTRLFQIPLASTRILSEIETLAKELDVEGPPYPFDSVCAFLATCLRVANQDMHLYRMQLEEKVLSWLIGCWQTAVFRDKNLPLHLGKDILMLFESISGFPMPIDLPSWIPLPEGQIIDVLVNEARTTVIKDYILEARLPEFKLATDRNDSGTLPLVPPSDDNPNSLVQPRGRERRISAFLVKTLERMQSQLDDRPMHPTAESARRSLDMAVTAVCYDSVLVLNGMQSDRRLSRCACKLIGTVITLLRDPRWTASERALISFGLNPLTFLGDSSEERLAWTAMLPPDRRSGIKYQLLSQISRRNTRKRSFLECSKLLRVLWQNADVQDTFNSVKDTMRDVLRITLGAKSKTPAHAMDVDDHFGPIRTATEQLSANKDDMTVELIPSHFTMNICISFLTVGQTLKSTSGEHTRDDLMIHDVLKCANITPEAFLSIVPLIIDKSQQRFLDISVEGLDSILDKLSELLWLYRYSRSNRLHSITIQLLEYTLEEGASANIAIGDTLSKFRQLCHQFSAVLKDGGLHSWGVRDSFARFINRYLTQGNSGQIWKSPVEDLDPSCLLLALSQDDDIRVRFRVSGLFAFAMHTVPILTTNELYLVKNKLTVDPRKCVPVSFSLIFLMDS
ncbi:hypothetical protein C0993_009110 [Termitomyces sp. T159_Od127]|nr:hypothetical protein C0993_009110 [Termitomyces sp. T159_Od127]